MMWQDFVFMIGSGLSVVFLGPTLANASARVPLGTSIPSMAIGYVYTFTFLTLGMTFSALGTFTAGTMWALITMFRSPPARRFMRATGLDLLGSDLRRWLARRRPGRSVADQYVRFDGGQDGPSSRQGHVNTAD
ncbi:hypothetical protein C482_04386 [Natrialba chahannaoensis JCM 10990]|uniref:Uncharacterized protein n=1 Tax=Natrialba chahannaoensis JCM 10990 TaxID=1227492 RepID=M0AWG5_9EURY|nr:hypothetical protein [Natrialba chahannaoensis]ELZ02870.1 hypothetical protein C482_04386 [Natrialba chahannaoensis JCM 10990]